MRGLLRGDLYDIGWMMNHAFWGCKEILNLEQVFGYKVQVMERIFLG